MKRLLAAATALSGFLALTGAAMAADPVIVDDTYDWSGLYIGLNAGYFWNETDASVSIDPTSNINATARAIAEGALEGDIDGDGFTGGLTVGANHQMNNIVFGMEGDINFIDLDEERDSGIVANGGQTGRGQDTLEGDFLATLRLRAGFAADRTLFYITGGAAFTDAEVSRTLDWSFNDGCPLVGGGLQRCHSGDGDFDLGWTVGAGIEHAFNQDWSIKAEYLYADFGKEKFTTTNVGIGPSQFMEHSFDLEMHIVRLGINWHF